MTDINAFLATVNKDNTRGYCAPDASDLSGLCKRANSVGGANRFKPRYAPVGECKASLKLKDAVMFAREMNAYDDTEVYAVPFVGEISENCSKNLYAFCDSLITANGIAGNGATWNAEIKPEFNVVILRCRMSIPD